MSIYTDNGFENRAEYLEDLADSYEIPLATVKFFASQLGKNEDFDGLICELEDYEQTMEEYQDEDE